jgi:CheY-like chemotaxis protein
MAKTILVADDDPAILDAIGMLLEMEGYAVITAVDGEAVEQAKSALPDLILLDIWMSGQDGRDICHHLKNLDHTKNIPVILISANRDAEKIALQCGADGFLAKPFDIDDLLQRVQEQLVVRH